MPEKISRSDVNRTLLVILVKHCCSCYWDGRPRNLDTIGFSGVQVTDETEISDDSEYLPSMLRSSSSSSRAKMSLSVIISWPAQPWFILTKPHLTMSLSLLVFVVGLKNMCFASSVLYRWLTVDLNPYSGVCIDQELDELLLRNI